MGGLGRSPGVSMIKKNTLFKILKELIIKNICRKFLKQQEEWVESQGKVMALYRFHCDWGVRWPEYVGLMLMQ